MNSRYLKDEVANVIFTKEEYREYLVKIISKVINIDEDIISKNLKLITPRVNSNVSDKLKSSYADVALENDSMYINIEVNSIKDSNVELKNVKYIYHLLLNQIPKGKIERIENIKRIIQININAYDNYGFNELIYVSKMCEINHKVIRDENIVIYDVNIEKIKEMNYNDIKKRSLEYYLFIFANDDKELRNKLYRSDNFMKKQMENVDRLTSNFDDDLYYDKKELLNTALFHEGVRQGVKEGHKQGVKEGHKQGIKENKVETAKKMIKRGYSNQDIQELIGLTIEEIDNLK